MRGWRWARRSDPVPDPVGPATAYPDQRGCYAEGAAPVERQPPERQAATADPTSGGQVDGPARPGGYGRRRGYRRDGIGR
ncbi:hypothetical protein AAH979_17185 [Plantactinospora sp. ZYX-F-223]|uniref:hypothetical protein n=1 Tax=Plantactinospora sp. ZYX-F-223 TaxID=3144103 RepID=UPI0031FD9060